MTKLDEVSHTLGELKANMQLLLQQHNEARESRKIIYAKIEGVEKKVDALTSQVTSNVDIDKDHDERLEAMEGTVNTLKAFRTVGSVIVGIAVGIGAILYALQLWRDLNG